MNIPRDATLMKAMTPKPSSHAAAACSRPAAHQLEAVFAAAPPGTSPVCMEALGEDRLLPVSLPHGGGQEASDANSKSQGHACRQRQT